MKNKRMLCFFILFMLSLSGLVNAAEKPAIFPQLGHSDYIFALSVSPDGKYVASGSADKTIKIWEISTGRELKTLKGHTASVLALAFSADGKNIISGSSDKTIRTWEISTGKELSKSSFTLPGTSIIVFSPGGKYAVIGHAGFEKRNPTSIKIIDVEYGREKASITIEAASDYDRLRSLTVSPDGKYLLVLMERYSKLFAMEDAREVKSYSHLFFEAAMSPKGKSIIFCSTDSLNILDIETGKIMQSLPTGHTKQIDKIVLSNDGKYAAVNSSDKTISLWDLSAGQKIRVLKGRSGGASPMVFSPDAQYLVSRKSYGDTADKFYERNKAKLWNVHSGEEIREFGGQIGIPRSVVHLPDGKKVLAVVGKVMILWDIVSGRKEREFKGHTEIINAMAVSPDGRHALSGSGEFNGISDNTMRLWDISSGSEIKRFTGHTNRVVAVAFSPNGKNALSGSSDNTVRLWEISAEKETRRFSGTLKNRSSVWGYAKISFSADGALAFAAEDQSTPLDPLKMIMKIYDMQAGREIGSLPKAFASYSLCFSPDKIFAFIGNGKEFDIFELPSGDKRKTLQIPGYYPKISPDTKIMATNGYGSNSIELYEISSGDVVTRLDGHAGRILDGNFSPDGRRFISSSADGTIRLWDTATGKEIAQFISFNDGEWIVITAHGYYKSSVNGDKHLNVRIGNNTYGIDQYRSTFYKPQIVEASLKLGDPQKAIAETIGEDKDKPPLTIASLQDIEPPFVVIKSPEEGVKVGSQSAEITLYVEDRKQTIKKIAVYVNGRVASLGEDRGVKISAQKNIIKIPAGKKYLDLKIPVSLDTGENLVEIMAFNGYSEGRKSIRIYAEEKATKSRDIVLPNLWILSIGINKYHDNKLTPLSYAVADAEGIVNAFKAQKGKLFREVNSLIINDVSPLKPSRDNIADNLDYVKRAGHNDVAILFIAGHGMNDDSGEFYFLPSDAVIADDGSIKKSKAISWRDIKAILDIPAKKLIFADTCHSEGVSGKKTRGVDNDRFVKELQEANAVIFTSSRGRELSQESEKWKHGAFTYALIEGIKGKADLINDGKISMKELDAYVSETVPQITNGAQHPITNTPDGYINFPVAIVE